MKRNLLFSIFTLLIVTIFTINLTAQKWTGKGDGTSWNDGANWDGNEVPAAGAIVKINKTYTITGTMPNVPAIVKVLKNANITFDLDMTIGDGVQTQHCLSIGAGSSVTLGVEGHNRVFNFKTPKHALAVFKGNDDVNIKIAKSSTLNIEKAGFGFNLGNTTSSITNEGIINIGSDVGLGMKIAGNLTNNGKIIGTSMKNKGLVLSGTFVNNGELSYTAPNDSSKLFLIDTFAAFQNNNTVFLQGGKDSTSFVLNGAFNNNKDAYLTINTGGIKVNQLGAFVNSGLVSMDTKGVFTTIGASTNNGFYSYASGNSFSGGPGTIVDNGLANWSIVDAEKNCTVDIAEEAYSWYYEGDSLGQAGADGSFTFPAKSVPSDSVELTTSLTGVYITVMNICDDAVDGGGCGEIASPESLGDAAICQGESIPALKVKETTGYVADWYDAQTGGTLLYTGLEYTPADVHLGDNIYYVENREESTGCTSDRTKVVLTQNSLPQLNADSTECAADNKTYTVFLSTGIDYIITSTAGTVDGATVTGIEVGTDVTITATNSTTGCTTQVSVTSPNCTVGTDDLSNQNFVVYPTIVRDGVLTVELTDNTSILNIISVTGKSLKKIQAKGKVKINVSDLDAGMYYIKVSGSQKTAKFIIIE